MVAEACRPPVLQQPRWKSEPVVAGFEIAVVHQNLEDVGDTTWRIVDDRCVQPFEAASYLRCKPPPGGGFGQDLHRDRVAFVFQPLLEACLVVHEVVLP